MQRRQLLQIAAGTVASSLLNACYLTERDRDPQGLSEFANDLQPEVVNAFRKYFSGSREELTLLAEFFLAANDSSNALRPLVSNADADLFSQSAFDETLQLATLTKHSYTFLHLPSRVVLAVVTGTDSKNEENAILRDAKELLSGIEKYILTPFKSPWLHIEVHKHQYASYSHGFNVFLRRSDTMRVSLAHELAHTYQVGWSKSVPIFIVEGTADSVCYLLTGEATYSPFITYERVHLDSVGNITGLALSNEGANGYLLFRDIQALLGNEQYGLALGELFSNPLTNGLEALARIQKFESATGSLDATYVRWIQDYRAP